MGLAKYRSERKCEPNANGSVAWESPLWMGGRRVSKVENCPAFVGDVDAGRRTAHVQGPPDTFFSIPAAVSMKGQRVRGFLTYETGVGYQFRADKDQHEKALALLR